jgi:hypothetical protein
LEAGGMKTYVLGIPANDVVRLLRREIAAANGQPELYYDVWEDYVVTEDFDRRAYGIHGAKEYSLVRATAVLDIEPRVERNYWALKVVAKRPFGPRIVDDANGLLGARLTLDEFAAAFLSPGNDVTVRLETETPEAKIHFDRWLADMFARHPVEKQDYHDDIELHDR